MKEYWNQHSIKYLKDDQNGLSAVCYSGMPMWYNNFLDFFQKFVIKKLVGDLKIKNEKILEIGCGTGRWCKFFWIMVQMLRGLILKSND